MKCYDPNLALSSSLSAIPQSEKAWWNHITALKNRKVDKHACSRFSIITDEFLSRQKWKHENCWFSTEGSSNTGLNILWLFDITLILWENEQIYQYFFYFFFIILEHFLSLTSYPKFWAVFPMVSFTSTKSNHQRCRKIWLRSNKENLTSTHVTQTKAETPTWESKACMTLFTCIYVDAWTLKRFWILNLQNFKSPDILSCYNQHVFSIIDMFHPFWLWV